MVVVHARRGEEGDCIFLLTRSSRICDPSLHLMDRRASSSGTDWARSALEVGFIPLEKESRAIRGAPLGRRMISNPLPNPLLASSTVFLAFLTTSEVRAWTASPSPGAALARADNQSSSSLSRLSEDVTKVTSPAHKLVFSALRTTFYDVISKFTVTRTAAGASGNLWITSDL